MPISSPSCCDKRALHSTSGKRIYLEHQERIIKADHADMRTLQGSHEADLQVPASMKRHQLFLPTNILYTALLIRAVALLTMIVCYVLGSANSGSGPWVSVTFAFTFFIQRANKKECSSITGQLEPIESQSYEEMEIAEWHYEVETFGRTYASSPLLIE